MRQRVVLGLGVCDFIQALTVLYVSGLRFRSLAGEPLALTEDRALTGRGVLSTFKVHASLQTVPVATPVVSSVRLFSLFTSPRTSMVRRGASPLELRRR